MEIKRKAWKTSTNKIFNWHSFNLQIIDFSWQDEWKKGGEHCLHSLDEKDVEILQIKDAVNFLF